MPTKQAAEPTAQTEPEAEISPEALTATQDALADLEAGKGVEFKAEDFTPTSKYTPWGTVLRPELMPGQIEDLMTLLLFGRPGKGKTTGLAFLANVGPTLLYDPENRYKRGALRRAGVNVDNIRVITDTSYGNLKKVADKLEAQMDQGQPIAGVVWDAVTEGTKVMLADMVDHRVNLAQGRGQEMSEFKIERNEYGDLSEMTRRIMRRLLGMPIHFGISALAKGGKSDEGESRIVPNLTAAVLGIVQAAVDVIMYLEQEDFGPGKYDTERYGLCSPGGGDFDAKDTTGLLPKRFTNPTFERILAYSAEILTPSNDPDLAKIIAARTAAATKGTN